MRVRTSSNDTPHGNGDSNHQVAPASANGATISASCDFDFPGVFPACTNSKGPSVFRRKLMKSTIARVSAGVRFFSMSEDTGTTP
jgi:hypothetical protein